MSTKTVKNLSTGKAAISVKKAKKKKLETEEDEERTKKRKAPISVKKAKKRKLETEEGEERTKERKAAISVKKAKKRKLETEEGEERTKERKAAISVKKPKKRKLETEEDEERTEKTARVAQNEKIQEAKELGAKKINRRPWRNKVRKKAAKLANKLQRMKDHENHPSTPLATSVQKDIEKKRAKRRARKRKMKLLKSERLLHENDGVERLKASRFRYINEQLYTMSGSDAQKLFQNDPDSFKIYHDGYRRQMKKWPYNPVSAMIQWLKSLKLNGLSIVDMGCGNAQISYALDDTGATIHSFDLVALNERVTACDMSKLPLEKRSVDIVIFCLSLMGTNLPDYIREANRILKKGGILKIAEVASRFSSVRQFIHALSKMGFSLKEKKRVGAGYFLTMELLKSGKVVEKHPPGLKLSPCYYKKR